MNANIIFPERNDYPDNLNLLEKKESSPLYRQLLESSASAYFETNFFTRYFFRKRFQSALELIPKRTDRYNILDAGCGIGFFLPTLFQVAQSLWAIDYAWHSLQYAQFMCKKRRLRKINFKVMDLTEPLPFPAGKFDLIICLSVLEHIRNLDKAAKNFQKVLKKDGILIAGYPNEDNLIFRFFQQIEKKLMRPKVYATLQGTKLIHFSRASKIDKALKKYFDIEKTGRIGLLPGIDFFLLRRCRLR